MTSGGQLIVGILAETGSADAQTGDIVIDASENVAIDGTGSDAFTGISNRVYENGSGSSGNIEITTASLSLTNGAGLSTNLSGQGNAGNIIVDAEDTVFLDGQGNGAGFFNRVTDTATGNAGNIDITTGSLTITNQASLDATSSGQGNAGNIIVDAEDTVFLDGQGNGAGFFNRVTDTATGNAGNIDITTGSLTITNQASLDATSSGQGNAGDIIVNASDSIAIEGNDPSSFFNTEIDVSSETEGNAGNIELNTGSLTLNDGAGLNTSNIANGRAGNITINATDNVSFSNGSNLFVVGAEGGSIQIDAKNLSLTAGSSFLVGINSVLNATGDIVFDGENDSFASGIVNILPENLSGSIGEINVTAQNLTITNGAKIQSFVTGTADSGDINLDIANSIKVDGFGEFPIENQTGFLPSEISSRVFNFGTGNAGSININTQNLELSRNGAIRSTNDGTGNAGNININAKQISISEQGNLNIIPSNISAGNSGEGTGGNININTDSLFIGDGGDIDASASNLSGGEVGDGGDITITATDTVFIEGTGFFYGMANEINEGSSGIIANVLNATGDAGDIKIDTAKLIVTDRASISADVVFADVPNFQGDSLGNGGSITLRASDLVEVSGSSLIRTALDDGASGIAGDLTIETENLIVGDGSQIAVTSFGDGNAGNLTIRASDSIELSGVSEELGRAGLFGSALIGSGNGGNLSVFTDKLIIRDGATIAASNFSSIEGMVESGTGQPGNVNIEANSISLEDNARIETATQSTEGEAANIDLTIAEDLTLQNNSFISARALENASGGNVTINADDGFILAFPNQNNDIIANAARGRGGAINIDTQAIFGLEERPLSPVTNDINASSQVSGLDGTIDINNPAIDPASGLVNLPTSVGDASDQISQNPCEQSASSEFLITGKGGFPANPQNNFSSNQVRVGLVQPVTPENQTADVENNTTSTEESEVVPAQGWVFNNEGKVVLTAYDPTNQGVQRNQQSLTGCSVSQNQAQQND